MPRRGGIRTARTAELSRGVVGATVEAWLLPLRLLDRADVLATLGTQYLPALCCPMKTVVEDQARKKGEGASEIVCGGSARAAPRGN